MDGFKAYKIFMATKLHFTTEKYDVFEKEGRVTGSRSTFEKRNDRFLFEKLSNKFKSEQDLAHFFVANFAYGNRNVIYSEESDSFYREWTRRKESRTQIFKQDLDTIENHVWVNKIQPSELFSIESGAPELLKLYLGGHVTLESMVIINEFENFLQSWEPLIMMWHDAFLIIRKAKRFVRFDQDKLQSIYKQHKETLTEYNHGPYELQIS